MAVATAITDEGAVDVRDRADVRRQVKLSVLRFPKVTNEVIG